jgi:prepilin-type N-terminal cleavage/methylation domain-containing protein
MCYLKMKIHKRFGGFSLIEISMVLAVLAVIVVAASVGTNILANVNGIRVQTDFVGAWQRVYNVYTNGNKTLPGDDPYQPTGFINGRLNNPLCNSDENFKLSNVFLTEVGRKIDLPSGRGPNQPHLYVFKDQDGVPQLLSVCFASVPWSTEVAPNSYLLINRHVLIIRGLTRVLATQLDVAYDGQQNSRFGMFRSSRLAASLTLDNNDWESNFSEVYLRLN